MTETFENKRTYLLGDAELALLGSREKLAQWRYRNFGPAWIKIGRKIAYRGVDINAWLENQRIDPQTNK